MKKKHGLYRTFFPDTGELSTLTIYNNGISYGVFISYGHYFINKMSYANFIYKKNITLLLNKKNNVTHGIFIHFDYV